MLFSDTFYLMRLLLKAEVLLVSITVLIYVFLYSYYIPNSYIFLYSWGVQATEANGCWGIEYCFNICSQHLFLIWTFCTPLFSCPVSASLWNRAAKRKKKEKGSFWSLETLVRQQCSAIFSFYTIRHENMCSLLFYIFFSQEKLLPTVWQKKRSKRGWYMTPVSRRCFRNCGLQIDLPVYWSGWSHPSKENNLPWLSRQQSFSEHLLWKAKIFQRLVSWMCILRLHEELLAKVLQEQGWCESKSITKFIAQVHPATS